MKFRSAGLPAMLLVATLASGCGGGGGSGGTPVAGGDDLRFALSWQGPADLDLSVTTPSGRRISFLNESADGCTLSGDAGDEPGPLTEVITCRNLLPGEYSASVANNESARVSASLEIRSGGAVIDQHQVGVAAGGDSGPFLVHVPGDDPGPDPGAIEGTWRESNARLRSTNCQGEINDLFEDLLVGAGGRILVERDGSSVTVSDPEDTATLVGGVDGTVIDVDTTVSESGGGCTAEAGVNIRADLGRTPTTATYTVQWSFRGCPGFSSCRQTIEARWRR